MRFANGVGVLIDSDRLQKRIAELGEEITSMYSQEDPPVLIGILKGCFVFMADLCRHIDLPIGNEFIGLSSYGDATTTSGEVRITLDLTKPIENRHVIVIEDIVDTSLTLNFLLKKLETRKPASIKICTLLSKSKKHDMPLDLVGFNIEDEFVIGFGLDLAEKYRNLPFVGVLS